MILDFEWFSQQFYSLEDVTLDTLSERLTKIGCEAEILDNKRLEVKIFPNRGDCLSVYGLAREYSAFYNAKLKPLPGLDNLPKQKDFFPLNISENSKPDVLGDALLEIANYRSVSSPPQVLTLLKKINIHGKDLAIDLSNLVSYELGIPLHVFDFDKVKSGLYIDYARDGEKVTVLNGQTVDLTDKNLIQRSNDEIVDLAGIMGGLSSCVTQKTERLLVQSAVFSPKSIYLSRRSAGFSTEASYRYERFVDIELSLTALSRFVTLLKKYQNSVMINRLQFFQSSTTTNRIINFDQKNIYRVLGETFTSKHKARLNKLGFELINNDKLKIPSWRNDIQDVYDISEEILRFSLVNEEYKKTSLKSFISKEKSLDYQKIMTVKQVLINLGFSEVSTDSLIGLNEAKHFYDHPLELKNPQNQLLNTYRTSLLIGLLKTVSKNQWLGKSAFFEIGQIYTNAEKTFLGIILYNYKESSAANITKKLAQLLRVKIKMKFNKVSSEILSNYNIHQTKVWYWESELNQISINNFKITPIDLQISKIKEVSKYPPSVRDITFEVNKNVFEDYIPSFFLKQEQIIICELIESFVSDNLGKDLKALTYRLILQSKDKTLTDKEVNFLLNKWLLELSKELKFKIR